MSDRTMVVSASHLAASAAVAFLGAVAVTGQEPPRTDPLRFAAASASADVAELSQAAAVIAEMRVARRLRLVSRHGDRRVPGRIHENFVQHHEGVPVHGAVLTRQLDRGGKTLSVLGTVHADIGVDTTPALSADEALALATEAAGAAPATDEPPVLVVLPTPTGRYVLAWRLTMKDWAVWFLDASTGEPVQRDALVERQEIAVGRGRASTGVLRKVGATPATSAVLGDGFAARDYLRPAEIVTLRLRGSFYRMNWLADPDNFWEPSDLAFDHDNDWDRNSVVDTHAHSGLAYDYLRRHLQWNGVDGKDGRIVTMTDLPIANAFWAPPPFGPEGTGMLVYGESGFILTEDASPASFASVSTVGHEMMHGVTHYALRDRTGSPNGLGGRHTYIPGPRTIAVPGESPGRTVGCGDTWDFDDGPDGTLLCEQGRLLLFWNEAGAMNEAWADVVGQGVEFFVYPPGSGPGRAGWAIGDDEAPRPYRSMEDPASVSPPHPDEMGEEYRFLVARVGDHSIRYTPVGVAGGRTFIAGTGDYDGVHWNSTILSHAFYLAVVGGPHATNGRYVEGVGSENQDQMTRIWFRAMTDMMPSGAAFTTAAAAVRQSAADLAGAGSAAHRAVDQALTVVGLPGS